MGAGVGGWRTHGCAASSARSRRLAPCFIPRAAYHAASVELQSMHSAGMSHFGAAVDSGGGLSELLDDFGALLDTEWIFLLSILTIMASTAGIVVSTVFVRAPALHPPTHRQTCPNQISSRPTPPACMRACHSGAVTLDGLFARPDRSSSSGPRCSAGS